MKLLLTNDDGIDSEGLKILADTLRARHDVWISAPDTERSASSHAITIHRDVIFSEVGPRTYSCSGTPADCVLYAVSGALPFKPDAVISGINIGSNIGTDVIYSGTVAAAREGAICGYPAFAVSAEITASYIPLAEAAEFVLRELEQLIAAWQPQTLLSINVPGKTDGRWTAAELSDLSYGNTLYPVSIGSGIAVWALRGGPDRIGSPHRESDIVKLRQGLITVSPIGVYPLCHEGGMRLLDSLSSARAESFQAIRGEVPEDAERDCL